jgi:chemotaxis protein MotA
MVLALSAISILNIPKTTPVEELHSPMQYSRASIAGAAVGFLLIITAILLGTRNVLGFLSIEGLMIVIGGSLAVAFMSFEANYVIEALRSIGLMFKRAEATHENLQKDLIEIINWARIVKDKGLLGLENETGKKGIYDPFVRYGIDMVISNYDPEDVRGMMETAANAAYERSTIPSRVLMAMAGHAPAFGMVGTLVGMVIMLGDLDGDMSGIGAGLAISLLATLYGVVTARMLYMPAASKLQQKQEALRFRNQLITEGLVLLVANRSPRYIQDRLNSFLRFESHYDIDARYKEIKI